MSEYNSQTNLKSNLLKVNNVKQKIQQKEPQRSISFIFSQGQALQVYFKISTFSGRIFSKNLAFKMPLINHMAFFFFVFSFQKCPAKHGEHKFLNPKL